MMQKDEGGEAVPACMAIPWLYSVGFSTTFGTLFAKIRGVYLIFRSAADLRQHMVTFQETFGVTTVVLLIDIAILTVWTAVDPLRWERITAQADKFGEPLESEGICTWYL
jgi:gamma-aminobutyric acid type B receptor